MRECHISEAGGMATRIINHRMADKSTSVDVLKIELRNRHIAKTKASDGGDGRELSRA
jgi:hypothetical protein